MTSQVTSGFGTISGTLNRGKLTSSSFTQSASTRLPGRNHGLRFGMVNRAPLCDGYTPHRWSSWAIAARTERMRLGTNLMLSLVDPVRIAEDAATLSLISGGALISELVRYRQLEFDQFDARSPITEFSRRGYRNYSSWLVR